MKFIFSLNKMLSFLQSNVKKVDMSKKVSYMKKITIFNIKYKLKVNFILFLSVFKKIKVKISF